MSTNHKNALHPHDTPEAEKVQPTYATEDDVSETDMSVGAIIKGTAHRPMDLFERKAALINA